MSTKLASIQPRVILTTPSGVFRQTQEESRISGCHVVTADYSHAW
jgi:hypothetical protein